VWRPFNRLHGNRSYKPGDIIFIKIIRIPGNDTYGIPPIFELLEVKAKIKKAVCLSVADLKDSNFKGSGDFIKDKKSLLHELSLIYNIDPLKIDKATYFDLEYL